MWPNIAKIIYYRKAGGIGAPAGNATLYLGFVHNGTLEVLANGGQGDEVKTGEMGMKGLPVSLLEPVLAAIMAALQREVKVAREVTEEQLENLATEVNNSAPSTLESNCLGNSWTIISNDADRFSFFLATPIMSGTLTLMRKN